MVAKWPGVLLFVLFLYLRVVLGQPGGTGVISQSRTARADWGDLAAMRSLVPVYVGGSLVVTHVNGREKDQFSVYSGNGQLVKRIRVDLPDADRTIQSELVPYGKGYVELAISVRGAQRDSMLCFLNSDGRLTQSFSTSPFSPELIAVAPDGSIWGFGSTNHVDIPGSDTPVLYRFSATGEVRKKLLPRKLFGEEPPFSPAPDGSMPMLAAAGDRVVLYAPETRSLYEFALDGRSIASYVVNGPEGTYPLPVVVTSHGSVYARLRGGVQGGLYELDRATSSWRAVPQDVGSAPLPRHPIGCDGHDLILSSSPSQTGVGWTRVKLRPQFPVAIP